MANEFRHEDVGDELTKAEWEGTATHIANSQATGDIIYCDGTYWIRLGKGTNGLYLKCADIPYWEAILQADLPALEAHKNSHDPNDGSDALDTAAPVKIGEANAIGTSHSLARADHVHEKHHGEVATITFIIDGSGSAIVAAEEKGHLEIPFACTITQVTMLADVSGSIVVDIWKDTYANFPPTDADSITAAAPPTITTAQKAQDSTLTDWTTAIAAGDILAFYVDSCTTITRVTISLRVTKT